MACERLDVDRPTDFEDIQPDAADNLREYIDRLVAEGYTVAGGESADPLLIDPGGKEVALPRIKP